MSQSHQQQQPFQHGPLNVQKTPYASTASPQQSTLSFSPQPNLPKWTQQKLGRASSGLAREYYERRDPSAMIEGSRRASGTFNRTSPSSKSTARADSVLKPSSANTSYTDRDFGSSFGTLKPSLARRSHRETDEEAPPSLSIYDTANLAEYSALKNNQDPVGTSSAGPHSSSTREGPFSALKLSSTTMSSDQGIASVMTPDENAAAIVIFGFPPDMIPQIVSHFSRFGAIRENVQLEGSSPLPKRVLQEYSSNETATTSTTTTTAIPAPPPLYMGANWIKLTYESPHSAARALSENGTLFQGQYLIGVTACTPQRAKLLEEVTAVASPQVSQKRGRGSALEVHNDVKYLVDQPPKARRVSTNLGDFTAPVRDSTTSRFDRHHDDLRKIHIGSGHGIFSSRQKLKPSNTQGLVENLVASHATTSTTSKEKESWLGWGKKMAETMLFGSDEY